MHRVWKAICTRHGDSRRRDTCQKVQEGPAWMKSVKGVVSRAAVLVERQVLAAPSVMSVRRAWSEADAASGEQHGQPRIDLMRLVSSVTWL